MKRLTLVAAAVAFGCAWAGTRCERTATGVWLADDKGGAVWNFEIDTPEGRPYLHPLRLPSGAVLTEARPKDHVWHLGCWFSWKYLNGVNYWEPADERRVGCEPAGRTRVTAKEVTCEGTGCKVDLSLDYGPRTEQAPILSERRTVEISPLDSHGGYGIVFRHRFTALADVTLDRTPPHGSAASGRWGGGYAGLTMRLNAAVARRLAVKGAAGGRSPAEVSGRECERLDFFDPATGEGFTLEQVAGPATARFYVWPDKRMINPSVVYAAPLKLAKGETLDLAYRLRIGRRSREP